MNQVNSKYVMERRLGGGGMAEVFLARMVGAEGVSRQVAIKRVLPGFSDNPQFAQMFVSEAQLTARLRHANIVSMLDFNRDEEGRLFLAMELVEGTDLDGLLRTGPLPFSLVLFTAAEILRGLDYAHELPLGVDGVRGIIHRDISPHNVLLGWDGSVKVSDFGIAKAFAASSATASEVIKGKPAYMSPEQAKGLPLDGRSDLFAVGVMLFEMLCLRHLFAGQTTAETFARLLYETIPDVRDLRPEVPVDLSQVVASLLMRERDQRMPSAGAAIDALVACLDYPKNGREELASVLSQRFVGRAPVRSRLISHLSHSDPTLVPSSVKPVPSVIPARRTATAGSSIRPTPERNRRWLWVSLVAILVCAGGIGILAATSRSSSTATDNNPPVESKPMAVPAKVPPPDIAPTTTPSVVPTPPLQAQGSADVSAPSVPKPPHPASERESTPASRGSKHRPVSAPPKPGGIREVTLKADPTPE